MNITWNAADYEKNFSFVHRYGENVLEKAGFKVVFASLFDRPTPQNTQDGLTDWIRMFVKKPFEGMDEALKSGILSETEDRLRSRLYVDGTWYIDYVRIRVKAVRA